MKSAVFDAANGFAGCIAGVHEVLRRQGLLEGTWCLDPGEGLSPDLASFLDDGPPRLGFRQDHLTLGGCLTNGPGGGRRLGGAG